MPQPAAMKRIVKRLALSAGGLLLLALLLPMLFEGAIGRRALEATRSRMRTELVVGGTSLSLLRDFPYASIGLTEVRVGDSDSTPLLRADRLSGRLSYWDLLFADGWIVNTIRVEDAEVYVHRDAKKRGNWSIFKPGKDSSASDIDFALSRVLLDEVGVIYIDDSNDTEARLQVSHGELTGAFGNTAYTLNGQFEAQSEFLSLAGVRYIADVPLLADVELDIDPENLRYVFGPSVLTLDGMPIDVAGTIGFEGSATSYDLQLETKQGSLGALLRALPAAWVTPGIRNLESQGDFLLSGTIAGLYSARQAPAISFVGELQDGSLLVPALHRKATNLNFKLNYSNGKSHSMAQSKLELSAINGRLDGQPFNGAFTWQDFTDPLYDTNLTGTLPLNWLNELWYNVALEGELDIRNFSLRGRQRHLLDANQARHLRTSGELVDSDVRLQYGDATFSLSTEQLKIDGPNLVVRGGSLEGLDNSLSFELDLKGFVPYLFGDANQVLTFEGGVSSPSIDLDRWVGLFGNDNAGLSTKGVAEDLNVGQVLGFAARLTLEADRLSYNEVKGRKFTGTCTLDDSLLGLQGEGYAMEGHWEVDGSMHLTRTPSLSAKLACSEVNITELFEQTNDVGQAVVASHHLEGQMTTRAFVEAAWDTNGDLDYDALHVWANVGLTDGELRDFQMLQALSRFVRSEELQHIRFTDVENWIEVDAGTVYLPAMFIQSTASNFTVAGEHSFEHDINYSIRVNGAQVLLNKLFGKRPGMDFLPDRRGGWVMTGFKIDGQLEGDRYDVRMAGGDVRRHFRYSQRRKDAIRDKLVPLFGQDRLIDDYDSDGIRIPGRPQRGSAIADAPTLSAGADEDSRWDFIEETETKADGQLVVDVDTDTYLAGWDEEEDVQPETARSSPAAALSKPRNETTENLADESPLVIEVQRPSWLEKRREDSTYLAPSERTANSRPERPRSTLFDKPAAPPLRPNKEREADEEYLEGFEQIKIPDNEQ